MKKAAIYISAINRHVTIGQYVQAVKLAKANPDATFKHGLTCWYSCTGKAIVNQFFEGLTERINDAIPYTQRMNPNR